MACIIARDGDTITVDTDHPAYPRARPGTDVPAFVDNRPAGGGCSSCGGNSGSNQTGTPAGIDAILLG